MGEESTRSNQKIAHEILNNFKEDKEVTIKAWNFHQPDTSLWWLIFTKDSPSEKYGKIAIYKHLDKPRLGIHLEKGISSKAAELFQLSSKKAEKAVITSSWKWNTFIEDIKDGELNKILNNIMEDLAKNLKIRIDFYPYNKLRYDSRPDDMISFEVYKNCKPGEECLRYIEEESRGNILDYIHINTLEGLLDILGDNKKEDKEQDWFWINVYIVAELDEDEISNPYKYASPFINNMEKYLRK